MANESCIQKKVIRRVRLFELDSCGRMLIAGTPVLDWDGFETIKWANVIEDGTDETITNVSGVACVDDPACPIDKGQTITFTECKDNWSLAALTGYGTLSTSGGLVNGFDRQKLAAACPNLAVEILFETPTLCDAGGNAQCIAWLLPLVNLFKDTQERTADGKTTIRGAYTARAKLSTRLFELTGGGNLPPAELDYWTPWITNVAAGDAYSLQRIVDCPTIADDTSCELRALDNL